MVLPITISLLIELCAIVIASSAFLFYLNRLGGWLLATWLRFKFWKEDNVYITIGSIQLSLLAGRISFRDFEYHSSNISARALHGHVTWRYWKFRTKQNEDVDTTNSLRGEQLLVEGVSITDSIRLAALQDTGTCRRCRGVHLQHDSRI